MCTQSNHRTPKGEATCWNRLDPLVMRQNECYTTHNNCYECTRSIIYTWYMTCSRVPPAAVAELLNRFPVVGIVAAPRKTMIARSLLRQKQNRAIVLAPLCPGMVLPSERAGRRQVQAVIVSRCLDSRLSTSRHQGDRGFSGSAPPLFF